MYCQKTFQLNDQSAVKNLYFQNKKEKRASNPDINHAQMGRLPLVRCGLKSPLRYVWLFQKDKWLCVANVNNKKEFFFKLAHQITVFGAIRIFFLVSKL
jgi:hypothetical protein